VTGKIMVVAAVSLDGFIADLSETHLIYPVRKH